MSRRKKILFISSWYPVEQNPTHGIFVQRHAEAVSLLNDVMVLYVCGTENMAQEFIEKKNEHFAENIYHFDKKNKSLISKRKTLKELYKKGFEKIMTDWGKPDLIHLNVVFPAGIFALELSKRHHIPMVITEHWTGYLPEDGSYKGILKKHFTKKIITHAKIICPVTQHLAVNMQTHGLNGNYIPVPNVVDTSIFSLTPRTATEKETVYLHLSSFDERQKRPRDILAGFRLLSEDNPDARFIFAGDGENINELKNLPVCPAPNKIKFHFRPMGEELIKIFHSADVLVLNSAYENLPVVILEALSCGLPVISSDVGGIKEYVNSENGILFDGLSKESFHSAMTQFLKTKSAFDKNSIRKFAIENFGKENISKKFDAIYEKVLKNV